MNHKCYALPPLSMLAASTRLLQGQIREAGGSGVVKKLPHLATSQKLFCHAHRLMLTFDLHIT